jgi:hypothetical protein
MKTKDCEDWEEQLWPFLYETAIIKKSEERQLKRCRVIMSQIKKWKKEWENKVHQDS